MKKYIKPLIVAAVIIFGMSSITGCKKDTTTTSAPVADEDSLPVEDNPPAEEEKPEEEKAPEKESMTLELGNDIGRNISKLSIRPDSESEWTEISIADSLWKSGYLIPVEIEAETIPVPENGWEIEVTFADDSTTKIYENVPLNTQKSIILTDEGAVFS